MELHPHLTFEGEASAAIAFYAEALGAAVERVVRRTDRSGIELRGGAPDAVAFASLRVGSVRITLSDAEAGRWVPGGGGVALSLSCPGVEAAGRIYEALASGGVRVHPFGASFHAAGAGEVEDRFGVRWRIEAPETGGSQARGAEEGALPATPFDIVVCGLGELEARADARATHVLSILDPDHPVPVAFGTWDEHAKLELRFHDLVEEGGPAEVGPAEADVAAILALGRELREAREDGGRARLLVHCHAGISRSTAAMALILAQAMPVEPADTILGLVHAIREKAWPNLRMMEIGDRMLGRGGALVAATTALHRRQLAVRPQLDALMSGIGRAREVAAARAAPAAPVADA